MVEILFLKWEGRIHLCGIGTMNPEWHYYDAENKTMRFFPTKEKAELWAHAENKSFAFKES